MSEDCNALALALSECAYRSRVCWEKIVRVSPSLPSTNRYAGMSARARPGAVSAEINIILQILGSRFQYVDAFMGKAQGHLSVSLNSSTKYMRIHVSAKTEAEM